MADIELSADLLNRAMQAGSVRDALEAKARRMLPMAQRLAYAAGRKHMGDKLRVEFGVRPGVKSPTGLKRPYAQLVCDLTEEEQKADDARAKMSMNEIMRRASRA